jgi:hypothetical protein
VRIGGVVISVHLAVVKSEFRCAWLPAFQAVAGVDGLRVEAPAVVAHLQFELALRNAQINARLRGVRLLNEVVEGSRRWEPE